MKAILKKEKIQQLQIRFYVWNQFDSGLIYKVVAAPLLSLSVFFPSSFQANFFDRFIQTDILLSLNTSDSSLSINMNE